eukprot:187128-Chlamydomonas_euryale.AAC.1
MEPWFSRMPHTSLASGRILSTNATLSRCPAHRPGLAPRLGRALRPGLAPGLSPEIRPRGALVIIA